MKDVFEMGDKAVLKEGVDLDEMLKIMFPSEDFDLIKELTMGDKAITSVAEHKPLLVEEVCDTGFFLKYEEDDDEDERLSYYYPKMFFEVAEDD